MTPVLVAVVIGRNEGQRLAQCLRSMQGQVSLVVYVDSGSTDGSLALANELGAECVSLDMRQPFTAARARNTGFRQALALRPQASFVQFVDGDCEVREGWLINALAFVQQHPRLAMVCGRRRERFPERSLYNWMCDREWDVPTGPALACGGDTMIRVSAFEQVGGYRDGLIAGEEPEMCVRLRAAGWQIQVLPLEMTWHDAAMTRFRQWWLRSVRAGHAYAEGAFLHGRPPERHHMRELARALGWGLVLPIGVLLASAFWSPLALAGLLPYALQFLRLVRREAGPTRQRLARAALLLVGKFAEAQGALRFGWFRARRRAAGLIEYK
jgi:GT2 family glycosyltransferase